MYDSYHIMKRHIIYWTKLLGFGLVVGLAVIYVVYFIVEISIWTSPVPSTPCCIPTESGLKYLEVNIPSIDAVTLAGWHIPTQNGATIILLHGYGANRASMIEYAEFLAQEGYGVLLYDMRGHGESGGKYRSGGWADVDDVAAAVEFLMSQSEGKPERIGILGFSTGGQVALRAAAQIDQLQAVIADGPGIVNNLDAPTATNVFEFALRVGNVIVNKGTEWRTGVKEPPAVIEVIGSIDPKPLLLIGAGPEESAEQRIVTAYYEAANEPKVIWEIPEASHGTGLKTRPDEYRKQVLTFMNESLLK